MEAIFKRRSIRKYTDKVVPDDLIEKILRAAMAAPSAGNQQPWHFVVIDDRDTLIEITKFHQYAQMLKEASHAIVVCGDLSLKKHEGYWVQDCSAAMQNMLLMAQDLGLCGMAWHLPERGKGEGIKRTVRITGKYLTPFHHVLRLSRRDQRTCR
jgi:nitroreductase